MPIKTLVVNASPIISLFKADLAFILPAVSSDIMVPGPVWREITISGHSDPAARGLQACSWAKQLDVDEVEPQIADWDLGAGEESVLSHVYKNRESHAVLDDAHARRCAYSLGISVIGTGGLLLIAKKKQVISSVREGLSSLKDAGLFIAPALEQMLLNIAGE